MFCVHTCVCVYIYVSVCVCVRMCVCVRARARASMQASINVFVEYYAFYHCSIPALAKSVLNTPCTGTIKWESLPDLGRPVRSTPVA